LGASIVAKKSLNDVQDMKNIWYIMNLALVGFALLGGYNSQEPQRLRNTNPDALFCGLILLTTPVFAVWSVEYSNRRRRRQSPSRDNLVRPSFHRNPWNLWGDPLQSLYISTCIMACMTLGGAVRRPAIGSVGFWTVGVYACFAVGLVIDQILIYRIYRDQIIEEPQGA
jgi:tellurite resistance protein TehA-like permease